MAAGRGGGVSALQVGERKDCTACGKPMIGALTATEKVAPVEVDPSDVGNVLLQRHADGVFVAITFGNETAEALRQRGVELRLNHFATCPERERFSKDNERTGT